MLYKDKPQSKGGELLRSMREARNMTQLEVKTETGIASDVVSRLENGQTDHPKRDTIEKILDCLTAEKTIPYSERCAVLALYGFEVIPTLPSADDIKNAIEAWTEPFKKAPYPAYLVDFVERIHDWNPLVLNFLGLKTSELQDITVFDLMFSQRYRGKLRLLNEMEIVTKTVTVMKSEFRPFLQYDWCQQCLTNAWRRYPIFQQIYDSVPESEIHDVGVRTMEPVIFSDGYGNELHFRVIGTDIVFDTRFCAVQYVPLDLKTAEQCFTLFG